MGAALAAAIAFGLGGRDAAARELERLQSRRSASTGSSGSSAAVGTSGSTSSASHDTDPLSD